MKRRRAQDPLPPRKSARLEELHQKPPVLAERRVSDDRRDSTSRARPAKRPHEPTTQASRKRLRARNDPSEPAPFSQTRHRRPRVRANEPTAPLAAQGEESDLPPLPYWVVHNKWPRGLFDTGQGMDRILARKRSSSSRSRKHSDTDSVAPSSTDQGEPKSREQKSAEYRSAQYATLLATKDVYMEESQMDMSLDNQPWYQPRLQHGGGAIPTGTLFDDDRFKATCRKIQDKNEARVIQDIARLIVPSAETLTTCGASHLRDLVESVNEGWNLCIPITKTRPQPDYAVGFRREAFTQDRLDRMRPVIGDLISDRSFFMATCYMYFPFLTCEVKCGAAALDIADRQNAHSTAIAMRAVVELFRAVNREKELHREILAFSVSHDHRNVRIYAHYVEIDDSRTKCYRHAIHDLSFIAANGREKWTAYGFASNVYNDWAPIHFARICSAIDQLPADVSFSASQRSSGLSQDLRERGTIRSEPGSASMHSRDNVPTSSDREHADREPAATPGTSVDDRAFKKPKRRSARARRPSVAG